MRLSAMRFTIKNASCLLKKLFIKAQNDSEIDKRHLLALQR